MPADAALALVQRGGLLSAGLGHLTNASIAICGSATTAKRLISGTSVGGTCTIPPRLPDLVGGGVDVVDADISDPARLRAHSLRVVRQVHQPADRDFADSKQHIGHAGHRRVRACPSRRPWRRRPLPPPCPSSSTRTRRNGHENRPWMPMRWSSGCLHSLQRARMQSVGRVARLGRNVCQPNHVLDNEIAGRKTERRPGAGEEWLAATKHDGEEVKSILINKTRVG